MPKRRDPNKPPRKFSRPLIKPFIQRLSDYSTVQLDEAKDDLQASTVFTDDIAGGDGELHEMKPEAMQLVQPAPIVPEYVKPVPIVRISKHEEQLRRTVARLKSLDIAMTLINSDLKPSEPKHNEVHTESKLVITVPPNPNAIKRRF